MAQCGKTSRAQHRAVALHDSKVLAVIREGRGLRIRLAAYVHVSVGLPGIDAGTGWAQELDLVLGEASLTAAPAEGTLWISEGQVAIDGTPLRLLPLELRRAGRVRMELAGAEGRLFAEAASISIATRGDPEFVEKFAGAAHDRPN